MSGPITSDPIDAPAPRAAGRGPVGRLVAGGVAAAVLIVAVLGGLAWSSREAALHEAEDRALRLARLVATDLGHVAAVADILLDEAEDLLVSIDWDRREAVEAASERLAKLGRHAPYLSQITLTGPRGELLVNPLQGQPPRRLPGDRLGDPARTEDAPAGTAIDRARAGAVRALAFSRRIDGGDPARRAGVAVTVDADQLVAQFRTLEIDPESIIEVVRDDGAILLREPHLPGATQAMLRKEPAFAAAAGSPAGTARYRSSADGVDRIHGFQQVAGRELKVNVGLALDAVLTPWWTRVGIGVGGLFLLLGGLGTIALLVRRRVHGDARREDALRSEKSSLEDLVQQRTETLQRTVAELKQVADERQLLFSELNHRIRNNLQLIGSLFSLQANRIGDPQARAVFEEGIERVHSISLVHDLLYQSPRADTVDISQLLRVLCDRLVTVFVPDGKVSCTVTAMSADISFDMAIRLGLVVNEIVSNLLKHSFPGDRRGHITVTFKEGEQLYKLTIVDDGIGPSMTTASGEVRLGAQLVDLLGRNLGALIHRERMDGAHRFELSLPR